MRWSHLRSYARSLGLPGKKRLVTQDLPAHVGGRWALGPGLTDMGQDLIYGYRPLIALVGVRRFIKLQRSQGIDGDTIDTLEPRRHINDVLEPTTAWAMLLLPPACARARVLAADLLGLSGHALALPFGRAVAGHMAREAAVEARGAGRCAAAFERKLGYEIRFPCALTLALERAKTLGILSAAFSP